MHDLAPGELAVSVSSPERIRAGTVQRVKVSWSNVGYTDIPAQLIELVARSAETAPPPFPKEATIVGGGGVGAGGGGGGGGAVGSAPTAGALGLLMRFVPLTLGSGAEKRLFLGVNQGEGPAGILPPGAGGEITLDFQGPDMPSPPLLVFETFTDTSPSTPFNWEVHKESLRPPSVPPDAWDVIFEKFRDRVGNTIEEYEAALASAANYLSQIEETATGNLATLVAFLIQQEDNAYPGSVLAGGLAAVAPASNLPLAFGRFYGQPISSRYQLGAFGRGWSHPFEMSLSRNLTDDGREQIIVHTPSGDRFFEIDPEEPTDPFAIRGLSGDPGRFLTFQTLVDPDGTTYQFGAEGRLTAVSYPQNRTGIQDEIKLGYTDGLLTTLTHSNGAQFMLEYNAQGRISRLIDHDGRATTYTYDASGEHLLEVSGPSGTVSYTYETGSGAAREHALTSITDSEGAQVLYTYDLAGRLVRSERNGGQQAVNIGYGPEATVTYTDDEGRSTTVLYNVFGQVARVRDPLGRIVSNQFDQNHNLDLTRLPGNLVVDYTFNPQGYLTRRIDAAGEEIQLSFRPTSGVFVPLGSISQTLRLARVTDELGVSTAYQYLGSPLLDLDPFLDVIECPDGSTETFQHDANGNVVEYTNRRGQTFQFTYNARGQMLRKENPDGSVDRFTYDSQGNLLSATDASGTVSFEYDGSGDVQAQYAHGLGLVSRADSSGTAAYYDYDATGSTAGLTGADGTYQNSYSNRPFGESLAQAETIENAFEYVGVLGVARDDSGLDYMRARYYSSSDGRFASADPIGVAGGLNLYRYVGNDPVSKVDPSGLNPALVNNSRITGESLLGGGRQVFVLSARASQAGRAAAQVAEMHGVEVVTREGQLARQAYLNAERSVVGGYGETIGNVTARGRAIHLDWEPFARLNSFSAVSLFFLDEFGQAVQAAFAWDPLFGTPYTVIDSAGLDTFYGGLACELLGCDLADGEDLSVTQQVASFDPNDIVGPRGFGPEGHIAPADQPLKYTIRFENLDEATAPAQVVTVTQQLDPDFDFNTLELDSFGFGRLIVDIPEGRDFLDVRIDVVDELGVYLDVDADFNTETGLLTWTFTSLDPETLDLPTDPLAGFLPPNVTSPEGEGFVSYRIRHKTGLETGTRLDAEARIVFDTNEPIDTPAIVNTIGAGPPASSVDPLPAVTSTETFTVSWSGVDDADGTPGSGIAVFDVFVSTDGGPFEPFVLGTPDTSAEFTGAFGHTYGFYSVATDNVGHLQPTPEAAQATTTVSLANEPLVADAGGPYSTDEGSSLTLDGPASFDPDESNSTLTFQWDLDFDGTTFDVDATGEQPTVFFADDVPARTIALRVIDLQDAADISTTTLEVLNVVPTLAVAGEPSVEEGASYTLTLGEVTDPRDDPAPEAPRTSKSNCHS